MKKHFYLFIAECAREWMRKGGKAVFWMASAVFWGSSVLAQNDHCANAIEIGPIGYTLGTWQTSEQAYLNGATIQTGEQFSNALYPPNNVRDKRAKSVWFKFSIPTARGVKIELDQTNPLIVPAEVGFEVFKVNGFPGCLPTLSQLSVFSIIDNLGASVNSCVEPGDYLIHVVSTNHASTNHPFFVKITTGLPSNPPSPAVPVTTLYDLKSGAHNMGVVSGASMNFVNYELGCHTVDDANETCSNLGTDYQDYTQSSWHVFTTDNFVDLIRVELHRPYTGGCVQSMSVDVGIKLWVGNVTTNPNLTNNPANLVNGECEKIVVDGSVDWKDFLCVLQPNTTYSIQLLFKKDYDRCIGVRVWEIGAGITQAPLPPPVPVAHVVNPLPASVGGSLTSIDDVWACNARTVVNPCGTVKPASGHTH
ncbi:MAG: hypothetical protein RMM53_09225 [Bacteroidia bacterium]|nr:hypothetical protein [Bacteroidia bacterium]